MEALGVGPTAGVGPGAGGAPARSDWTCRSRVSIRSRSVRLWDTAFSAARVALTISRCSTTLTCWEEDFLVFLI